MNPGVEEQCNNGVDDNCSGVDNEPGSLGCIEYWLDADGDNYGNPDTRGCACTPPAGAVFNDDDCADTAFDVNPGAPERPDGVDNNCNGTLDEGTIAFDNDGDGYCAGTVCTPQPGGTPLGGDCDDQEPRVSPGATEVCNSGLDENCNRRQDEGFDAIGCTTYFLDEDGDDYGTNQSRCTCGASGGSDYTALNSDDCYDGNADAYPGQSRMFGTDRGDGRFDYDCDGDEEQLWPDEAQCECKIVFLILPIVVDPFIAGWKDTVPECGRPGDWYEFCEWFSIDAGSTGIPGTELSFCLPIEGLAQQGTDVRQTQRCN